MPESIVVSLNEDRSRFLAYGGSPMAKDEVYAAVTSWPGWQRTVGTKQIGGRRTAVYSAPVLTSTAMSLANTTLRVEWLKGTQGIVELLLENLRWARRKLNEDRSEPDPNWPGERQPMKHQRQAVGAIPYMNDCVLLADDMGLGKTSTSLWAAKYAKGITRILVVCPASVKFNWEREVKATIGWDCHVVDGTPKQRASVFTDLIWAVNHGDPLVAILNYDLLIGLSTHQANVLVACVTDQALICDESQYLKSRKSKRTKFVMRHLAPPAGGAKVRILCSGTPVLNLVDDLWSQIQILRPGTWISFWDFCRRHVVFSKVKFGNQKQGKPVASKNVEALNAIVNTLQISRDIDTTLYLPPKIHTYPELELTGDHKTIYQAMKKLAVLEIEALGLSPSASIFAVQARSAVLAMLRCEQIAQGFCGGIPESLVEQLGKVLGSNAKPIPGRPREIIFPTSPKLIWLTETLNSLLIKEKRVVVFSRFNAPMFWLEKQVERMGGSCSVMHGGLTSKEKHQVVQNFQDDCYDVLFVQVKMAIGFNLHNAQNCIFLGRDWSPALNKQAEGRLHRKGQIGTVNVQIPIVRGTVEAYIHKKLMSKDADAEQALKNVTIKELLEML